MPGGGFEGKFGCQSGIPTVLYARAGRALVFSPARNWMTAVHAQGNASVGVGIAGVFLWGGVKILRDAHGEHHKAVHGDEG